MRDLITEQLSLESLPAGSTLLVGVSGGVDSVVLLHLLLGCAEQFRLRLQVAHLDHGIRPESRRDAEFVRQLCAAWRLSCQVAAIDVPALAAREGLSLEMAGRQARRDFLQQTAAACDASAILLGHHRDDQAETFLLRLLRGSGSCGLAAMAPRQGLWWRPLLNCSREQILAYAHEQRLSWVEDQSNADPAYLRNRLRHQLLPQLREINPRIDEGLGELCRQLQEDEIYWAEQVAAVLPALLQSTADGLRLSRDGLLSLPLALRRRVLRAALLRVRGDLQRLEAGHLRALDALLEGERPQAGLMLPGCWVGRRYGAVWLRSEPPAPLPDYDLALAVPGELQLPCGRVLRASLQDEQAGESRWTAEFSVAELAQPLRVRNWRPGDRIALSGLSGRKRLKTLFGDEKVELEERSRVPLVVCGEEIIWLAGCRRAACAPAAAGRGQVLRLELF